MRRIPDYLTEVWASAQAHKVRAGMWRFSAVMDWGEARTHYGAAVRSTRRSALGSRWWQVSVEVQDGALEHFWAPTLVAAKWAALRHHLAAMEAEKGSQEAV